MAISISGSSNQSTNEGANQSTVNGYGSMTLTVGYFSGLQSWGRVTIGGVSYDVAGPTSMSQGQSWNWSYGRVFNHDVNGYRGPVDVSVSFRVDGTSLHQGSAGAGTQGAIDYNRAPVAPSSVTPAINADKSITVTSNAVSSPAGTPTYYIQYASSANNSTWSGWSSETTISSNARTFTYSVGSLTFGLWYKFRMRASNSDGFSAYTESASVLLSAAGKRFNGTSFVNSTTGKIFNGSSWVPLSTAKRFNGSSWVNIT